jgi:hypothetical protein
MDNLVAPATPQASVQPQASAPSSDEQPAAPQLPASLTKVPAIQGLLAGAPPAVSARIKQFEGTQVGKDIVANKDALLAAGFAFYKSRHGDLAVLYNRFHIHGSDIQSADKAGKLQILAPPFEQVDHALAKAGKNHPLLKNPQVPQGFASPTPQAAPQDGSAAAQGNQEPQAAPASGGASAALAKRLQAARLTAVTPGAPTSGPAPGAGRLLNSILKPVV